MEQTLIRSLHNMLVLRGLDGVDHALSDVTLVGREAECQLQLLEGHASRYHAKLTVTGPQQILVEDLKSTNGTFVNGQRVDTPMVATLGDELRFDTSRFRIATAHSGGANATVFRDIRQELKREEALQVQPDKIVQPEKAPEPEPAKEADIDRNRLWDRSSVPQRDRETMAPAPAAPKPQPRPAPQMMTPAPQQPDVAAPLAVKPPQSAARATASAPATASASTTSPDPAISPFPTAAPTKAPEPAATWVDVEAELPDPLVRTGLPSSGNGLLIEHTANFDQAIFPNPDANSTITAAPPKKPADEHGATDRSAQKKVAQFGSPDQPVTGTSSLPVDELANLALKSSRTVRRNESTQGPRLIVLNPPARGMIFPLTDSGAAGEWLVGRGEDADVALTDRTVSVRHAFIRKNGSRWEIENLNATNGVFVNGKLVSRRIVVNGDKVRLGRTEMQFRTDSDPGAEIAEATPASSGFLTPGVLLGLAGAVFAALFVLILILVMQRGP